MDEVEETTELVGEHCELEVAAATVTAFTGDAALGVGGMSRSLSLLQALATLAMGTRAMGWFKPNRFLEVQCKLWMDSHNLLTTYNYTCILSSIYCSTNFKKTLFSGKF